MRIMRKILLALAICSGVFLNAQQKNEIEIQLDKIGTEIKPTMYGHFFEDINYAADGGLYAELIKNRSFEFPQNFMGWRTFGNIELCNDGPFERNPHYVRLNYSGHPHKQTGLENEGFFGIGIKAGEEYRFSVWGRGLSQKIRVELVNNSSMSSSQVITSQEIEINSSDWKKYEIILAPKETYAKSHLRIFLLSEGKLDLEHISLFPVNTWKNRTNGLRKDLVQALAGTKPGVFRFPGGCIVEGTDLETRYNWKNSIGPVENRPLNENRWNYSFQHRFYPDYYQTYGLGFYELFLLSEDLGVEPLPVVSCGLSCQFQNESMDCHASISELSSYIQDALDLIEFANGAVDSKWGSIRAEMGHPAPFNLKYIGVGNEQWGPEYPERLEHFVKAIHEKYPDINIVGSSGPFSEGDDFKYLWAEMNRLKVDLVDEHFYRDDKWFLNSGQRYDGYDRNGAKVFAGEYACHGKGGEEFKYNHFHASLLEAAFLTGVERNADVVYMASYAPLLAHVEGWQWRPDLIWFDNLSSVRTCSWYVQSLYGNNKGTNVISLKTNGKPLCGMQEQNGLFGSAVWDKNEKTYIVKLVNVSDENQTLNLNFKGAKKNEILANGRCIVFTSDDMFADNTLQEPYKFVPKESYMNIEGETIDFEIKAKSFVVLKFQKMRK